MFIIKCISCECKSVLFVSFHYFNIIMLLFLFRFIINVIKKKKRRNIRFGNREAKCREDYKRARKKVHDYTVW